MNRKYVFLASVAALVVLFAVALGIYRSEEASAAAESAARNRAYLVRDHSPGLGKPTARVHIVEFLDPACDTCRSFYPLVKQMLKNHPDDIRLSVRHVAFHPGADEVVRVLEAARAQDKYWQTLDALLAAQPQWVTNHRANAGLAWRHLDGLGLDLARLKSDVNAPEVAARVAQDRADAAVLNVTMTPEFFVNGKPLPSFGYEQLNSLVLQALADAS